ncbi:MAG: hypothetical protein K0S65_3771 [Labilithrix sp.]|nr:hypothetical protein [Labilithrix sp.]
MTIPATSGSRPTRFREDEEDALPQIEPQRRRSHEPLGATGSKIDADILAFVHASKAKETAAPPAPSPKNERVLYVGMNDVSKDAEADGLRKGGAQVTTVLRNDNTAVRLDGADFDLADTSGCAAFASRLAAKHGLSPDAETAIAGAIGGLGVGARDELARVVMVLAPGERGAAIPSRLMLSGHSDGSDVHMGGESLKFTSVLDVLRAMPNAARQIEDVHFSGCFTSAQIYAVEEWRSACPNLKSMWGYSGIAPGTPVGQIQAWERSTRGRVASDPVRGARSNVTSWSVEGGIKTGTTLAKLREQQVGADAIFGQLWGGQIQSGPWGQARVPYETYRELSNWPSLSLQEKDIMKAKADVLLRIRYYEGVRSEIVKEHGESIRSAYQSLGMAAPDFTRLSRKEAVESLRAFEERARSTTALSEAAAKAAPLLRGFRELDPKHVPDRWCH